MTTKTLSKGTKVERGRGLVFRCTIVGRNPDGTYLVRDPFGNVDSMSRRSFRLVP